jgi:Putative peptidoglycan binding domain
MKLSSSTNVLQNGVAQLVLLVLTVLATACSGSQKHDYSGYGIVPAYRHYDARQLRQVQIELRRQGYYSGSADGFLGYRTDQAISRFQLDHEHPVRPVVDRWLLVNLGIIRPLVD